MKIMLITLLIFLSGCQFIGNSTPGLEETMLALDVAKEKYNINDTGKIIDIMEDNPELTELKIFSEFQNIYNVEFKNDEFKQNCVDQILNYQYDLMGNQNFVYIEEGVKFAFRDDEKKSEFRVSESHLEILISGNLVSTEKSKLNGNILQDYFSDINLNYMIEFENQPLNLILLSYENDNYSIMSDGYLSCYFVELTREEYDELLQTNLEGLVDIYEYDLIKDDESYLCFEFDNNVSKNHYVLKYKIKD